MMAETSFYRPEVITSRQWAKEGKFGTIFYTESEYHHDGLISLMFDERGFPNWRHGLPPMHYPTHCTGMIVPVTGERLVEVSAIGWGDGHEVLKTNLYKNPFWNTTAFFKTSGGHSSRVSVFWHVAAGGTERGAFYGDRMSYIMAAARRLSQYRGHHQQRWPDGDRRQRLPGRQGRYQSVPTAESLREASRIAPGPKRPRRLAHVHHP